MVAFPGQAYHSSDRSWSTDSLLLSPPSTRPTSPNRSTDLLLPTQPPEPAYCRSRSPKRPSSPLYGSSECPTPVKENDENLVDEKVIPFPNRVGCSHHSCLCCRSGYPRDHSAPPRFTVGSTTLTTWSSDWQITMIAITFHGRGKFCTSSVLYLYFLPWAHTSCTILSVFIALFRHKTHIKKFMLWRGCLSLQKRSLHVSTMKYATKANLLIELKSQLFFTTYIRC
jgi:hypothetical protein